MAEFEETQPEETKVEAPTRLESLKMSLTEYAEATKSYSSEKTEAIKVYTTEKYEATKKTVNETVVEPYARAGVCSSPRSRTRISARRRRPRDGLAGAPPKLYPPSRGPRESLARPKTRIRPNDSL